MNKPTDDDFAELKALRQKEGAFFSVPISDGILWNYGSRNAKTGNAWLPDYLQPSYRTYPQILKDVVRNFLHTLHRKTLGRLGGRR